MRMSRRLGIKGKYEGKFIHTSIWQYSDPSVMETFTADIPSEGNTIDIIRCKGAGFLTIRPDADPSIFVGNPIYAWACGSGGNGFPPQKGFGSNVYMGGQGGGGSNFLTAGLGTPEALLASPQTPYEYAPEPFKGNPTFVRGGPDNILYGCMGANGADGGSGGGGFGGLMMPGGGGRRPTFPFSEIGISNALLQSLGIDLGPHCNGGGGGAVYDEANQKFSRGGEGGTNGGDGLPPLDVSSSPKPPGGISIGGGAGGEYGSESGANATGYGCGGGGGGRSLEISGRDVVGSGGIGMTGVCYFLTIYNTPV